MNDEDRKAEEHEAKRAESVDDPPPILGSWTNVYAAVLAVLVVLIGVFYWLTERFS
ncbi:MAG: hypothetical protein ACI9KE_002063 [Polyangiales bacterium]|jgi:hypothetical protein